MKLYIWFIEDLLPIAIQKQLLSDIVLLESQLNIALQIKCQRKPNDP
jgi:hypothetical protein